MSIAQNLAEVQARIEAAARRAQRNPAEVTLMAVTKTLPPERIREAYAAGQRVFGENRVQEFSEKFDALTDLTNAEFHLIGHLQSNKSSRAVDLFGWVDSLDSLRLAERLNDATGKRGKRLPVLLEVNVGGERQKSGVPPCSRELEEILQAATRLEHLDIRGLMTIPPIAADPEAARTYFRMLRQIAADLAGRKLPRVGLEVLSMGMSHDFEIAVEEGSTCVRVGTAIFGDRPKPH